MKLKSIAALAFFLMVVASCGQESVTPEPHTQEATIEAEASIEDIAVKRPDEVKVLFQNEYLRVLRFDLDPNEALPPHLGKNRVVYSLTDYEVDWTEGGDALGRRTWSKGDVHAHAAAVHSIENTGETKASFVVFERLDSQLPPASTHEEGSELPAGARSLFANADFDVLEVELQPGEGQDSHEGGWRAIYSLADYTIEWQEDDTVEQKSWSTGDVHWHAPALHAAKNTGNTQARWIVVGIKN